MKPCQLDGSDPTNRRSFLQALGAVAAGVGLRREPRTSHNSASLEPWLAGLNGTHRQFFDVGGIADGKPLMRTSNFLSAYVSAYSLKETSINAIFGAHAAGLAFVSSHAVWARYHLGELFSLIDAATGKPAERNVYVADAAAMGVRDDATVSSLMTRGVRFLACKNSIDSLAKRLAPKGFGTEGEIRDGLLHGLLPGVFVVPAMLVAGNRAQEAGISYAFLS